MGKASQYFRSLSQSAFSLRKALSVPILSKFAEPFCDFKYKSKGINDALQWAFGKDYFFGQKADASDSSGDQVKVGVISCVEGRFQPCLIANYSRNPPEKLKDGREGCKLSSPPWKRESLTVWQTTVCNERMNRKKTFLLGKREQQQPRL